MPRPLIDAQKGAQKKTNHQKTPKDRAAQERAMKKDYGRGQESRDWIHTPPQDRQVLGRRLKLAGGRSGSRNGGGRMEPRREHPQGLTGTLATLRV